MNKPWFQLRVATLLKEKSHTDEHWQTDYLSDACMLVRVDNSDPDYGGGECEWFTVLTFENYTPTVLGPDCVWRDDLERCVAQAEREEADR